MRRVPLPPLLRLRDWFQSTTDRSLGHRWGGRVLEVVRLRGIPDDQPFSVGGAADLRFVPCDSYIAAQLYWLGIEGYEEGGPRWWSSLVECHSSVLELGGNIGLYTVVGAASMRPGARYRVVEANPVCCESLRRNLEANGFHGVEVIAAAVVGDRSAETVELHLPDRDAYTTSLIAYVSGAEDIDRPASSAVNVDSVSALDLIDGVDLIKLDIEGMEAEVLGSIRSWILDAVPTVVVEVNDQAQRLQSFLSELIPPAGYACAVIAEGTGQPKRISADEATAGALQATYGRPDLTLARPDVLDRVIGRS